MQPAHESAVLALAEAYLAEETAAQSVEASELTAAEALLMFYSRLAAAQQAGLASVLLGDDGRVYGMLLALTDEALPEVPRSAALVSDAYVVREMRRGASAYPLWRSLCDAVRDAGKTHLYASTRNERLHSLLRKLGFVSHPGLPLEEPDAAWFRLTLAVARS